MSVRGLSVAGGRNGAEQHPMFNRPRPRARGRLCDWSGAVQRTLLLTLCMG